MIRSEAPEIQDSMAPTLKEVNTAAAAASAASRRGEIGSAAPEDAEPENNIMPIVSSCDNSNEAIVLDDGARGENDGRDDDDASAAGAEGERPAAAGGAAGLPPVGSTAGAMTSATKTNTGNPEVGIELEDPSSVPPDEMAFVSGPHFDGTKPFHRSLSGLDLSVRCPICRELFRAPVLLFPCMHNFCSLCVRNHFKHTFNG